MAYIPTQLAEIERRLRGGEGSVQVPLVRSVIAWYGAERRSSQVIKAFSGGLRQLGLVTRPDFESAFIDGPMDFLLASGALTSAAGDNGVPGDGGQETAQAKSPESDATFRIGRLAAANRVPLSVTPSDSVMRATTLMMEFDYSQLPVLQSERALKGVVSWRSVGPALALGSECHTVSQCMDPHVVITSDRSLFDAIPLIVQHGYVLVQGVSGKIDGIVTATDLTEQFKQLAEPFLLLGEIESHLRNLIDSHVPPSIISAAKRTDDTARVVESAADLTFGEYARVLEQQSVWASMELRVDRNLFLRRLEEVRRVRNDVMHFDPDGIAPADEKRLRDFVNLLRLLARYSPQRLKSTS